MSQFTIDLYLPAKHCRFCNSTGWLMLKFNQTTESSSSPAKVREKFGLMLLTLRPIMWIYFNKIYFFALFFQVKEPESFRQLSLPQIEIPFRDMASIVTEAEAAIVHRFEVLEPQIYNSNARQVPKSPEWFMSASSKIKVIAKNMTKVALVAEEVAWFNLFDLQALRTKLFSRRLKFYHEEHRSLDLDSLLLVMVGAFFPFYNSWLLAFLRISCLG